MNKKIAGASSSVDQSNREQDAPATPMLRFPEFRDAEGWKLITLQQTSTPVTERVGERKLIPVSISAGVGFVAQSEKFGRDISGNQYQLYTLARDGDFVFNKGNSLRFPQGCIYQLQGWGEVAAPNVFICFRLKNGYLDGFFQQCFEQNQHGRQLKRHITSGARSNGLLNISKETFFSIEIPTPTLPEQQRIADCLSSLDALITAQARKVDALKSHKKGLMQQLFPRDGETQPRLRFPEFQDAGEWKKLPLGEVTTKTDQRNTNGKSYPVYSISNKTGFTPQSEQFEGVDSEKRGYDISLYKLVGQHTFAYNPARINVGSIGYSGELNNIIISSLYVCFKTHPSTDDMFLRHFFDTNHFEKAVRDHVEGGIRSYLFYENFARISIALPTLAEQQRIADCLSSLDDLITAATRQLATLKTHKQGLMQQLFPNVTGASSSADIHTREHPAPATHP